MKLHHARPICRAPNRFSPSALLYQHFIDPYHAAHQQRFSSSAPAPEAAEELSKIPPGVPDPTPASRAAEANHQPPVQPRNRFFENKHTSQWGRYKKLQYLVKEAQAKRKKGVPGKKASLVWQAQAAERYVEDLLFKAKLACDEGKEYKGVLMKPYRARVFVQQKWPWAAKTLLASTDAMSRLNREINDFYEYAKPSRAEVFARKNVVEQVRADVRKHLPDHVLEVFGSERTGIALALSDIDLRLVRREKLDKEVSDKLPTSEERRELLHDLYTLRRKVFAGRKNASAAKYTLPNLRYARYPLISVQDLGSGLDVQIVSANNTAIQREFMQRYMSEYPYLRQTYAVIKTMFDQRGLSNVFRGGFGSYPLFMMIVASLQNQANQRRDAAGAILNFLYYWAYFKTREHGVSIAPSEYFNKRENPILTDNLKSKISEGTIKPLPDYMLSLRDPAEKTNDLGRKGTAILHVQATLRHLTVEMIKTLNANERNSFLAPLVGEVYARDKDRREKLADHGSWVQRQVEKSFATAAKESHEGGHHHQASAPQQEKQDSVVQEQEQALAADPAQGAGSPSRAA